MVNTVGSYKKYWQKEWIPIKKMLRLNSKQKSLIIGSLLGDGTMWLGKNAKNVNFKVEQGLVQKEYVFWKYNILKRFVFTEPKLSYRYNEKGKYPKSWWFRTIRHPIFTKIYNEFYTGKEHKTGKKIIPKNLESDMDPLVLAVWIMDDGSYSKKRIDISTYSFTLKEIHLLQNILKKVFNIESCYHKDRNIGFRMYFDTKNTKKVIKTIYPYIIPTMMYKIGL